MASTTATPSGSMQTPRRVKKDTEKETKKMSASATDTQALPAGRVGVGKAGGQAGSSKGKKGSSSPIPGFKGRVRTGKEQAIKRALGITLGALGLTASVLIPVIVIDYRNRTPYSYTQVQSQQQGKDIFKLELRRDIKASELVAISINGYTFKGYYLDEACTQPLDPSDDLTAKSVIFAQYVQTFQLTIRNGEEEIVVDYFADTTLADSLKQYEGEHFEGWYANEELTDLINTEEIQTYLSEDATVFAKYYDERTIFAHLDAENIFALTGYPDQTLAEVFANYDSAAIPENVVWYTTEEFTLGSEVESKTFNELFNNNVGQTINLYGQYFYELTLIDGNTSQGLKLIGNKTLNQYSEIQDVINSEYYYGIYTSNDGTDETGLPADETIVDISNITAEQLNGQTIYAVREYEIYISVNHGDYGGGFESTQGTAYSSETWRQFDNRVGGGIIQSYDFGIDLDSKVEKKDLWLDITEYAKFEIVKIVDGVASDPIPFSEEVARPIESLGLTEPETFVGIYRTYEDGEFSDEIRELGQCSDWAGQTIYVRYENVEFTLITVNEGEKTDEQDYSFAWKNNVSLQLETENLIGFYTKSPFDENGNFIGFSGEVITSIVDMPANELDGKVLYARYTEIYKTTTNLGEYTSYKDTPKTYAEVLEENGWFVYIGDLQFGIYKAYTTDGNEFNLYQTINQSIELTLDLYQNHFFFLQFYKNGDLYSTGEGYEWETYTLDSTYTWYTDYACTVPVTNTTVPYGGAYYTREITIYVQISDTETDEVICYGNESIESYLADIKEEHGIHSFYLNADFSGEPIDLEKRAENFIDATIYARYQYAITIAENYNNQVSPTIYVYKDENKTYIDLIREAFDWSAFDAKEYIYGVTFNGESISEASLYNAVSKSGHIEIDHHNNYHGYTCNYYINGERVGGTGGYIDDGIFSGNFDSIYDTDYLSSFDWYDNEDCTGEPVDTNSATLGDYSKIYAQTTSSIIIKDTNNNEDTLTLKGNKTLNQYSEIQDIITSEYYYGLYTSNDGTNETGLPADETAIDISTVKADGLNNQTIYIVRKYEIYISVNHGDYSGGFESTEKTAYSSETWRQFDNRVGGGIIQRYDFEIDLDSKVEKKDLWLDITEYAKFEIVNIVDGVASDPIPFSEEVNRPIESLGLTEPETFLGFYRTYEDGKFSDEIRELGQCSDWADQTIYVRYSRLCTVTLKGYNNASYQFSAYADEKKTYDELFETGEFENVVTEYYSDEGLTSEFDISQAVNTDTTIYAGYKCEVKTAYGITETPHTTYTYLTWGQFVDNLKTSGYISDSKKPAGQHFKFTDSTGKELDLNAKVVAGETVEITLEDTTFIYRYYIDEVDRFLPFTATSGKTTLREIFNAGLEGAELLLSSDQNCGLYTDENLTTVADLDAEYDVESLPKLHTYTTTYNSTIKYYVDPQFTGSPISHQFVTYKLSDDETYAIATISAYIYGESQYVKEEDKVQTIVVAETYQGKPVKVIDSLHVSGTFFKEDVKIVLPSTTETIESFTGAQMDNPQLQFVCAGNRKLQIEFDYRYYNNEEYSGTYVADITDSAIDYAFTCYAPQIDKLALDYYFPNITGAGENWQVENAKIIIVNKN